MSFLTDKVRMSACIWLLMSALVLVMMSVLFVKSDVSTCTDWSCQHICMLMSVYCCIFYYRYQNTLKTLKKFSIFLFVHKTFNVVLIVTLFFHFLTLTKTKNTTLSFLSYFFKCMATSFTVIVKFDFFFVYVVWPIKHYKFFICFLMGICTLYWRFILITRRLSSPTNIITHLMH